MACVPSSIGPVCETDVAVHTGENVALGFDSPEDAIAGWYGESVVSD